MSSPNRSTLYSLRLSSLLADRRNPALSLRAGILGLLFFCITSTASAQDFTQMCGWEGLSTTAQVPIRGTINPVMVWAGVWDAEDGADEVKIPGMSFLCQDKFRHIPRQ